MQKLMKALCMTLCILMCVSTMSVFIAGAEEYSFSYLQNTYSKIMAGETVNIAYYGGSVTNGYAGGGQDCQSNGKAWRSRTFQWFKDTFADTGAAFVENHAALGGTGTGLNIYRADEHLYLGTDKAPDLIFIEFAINDSYKGYTYEQSAEYMEAIIRKLYKNDPYIDIVIVLTTDNGKKDTEFVNAKAHADVAAKYDIPVVWVGAQIYRFLRELNGGNDITNVNGEPWSTYFADGCHPNAEGHAKYTEYIVNDILVPNLTADGLNLDPSKRTAKVMPEGTPLYHNGRYVDSYGTTAGKVDGFKSYSFGSDGSKIYANTPGASFSVNFHGTGFGIIYTASPSNGIVVYNVDGGAFSSKNLYNSGSGTNHVMLVSGLAEGDHTLNLIFRKSASGSYLAIQKFLVDGDPEKTPLTFGEPPTNSPNNDVYIADITLAPNELNTVISGGGYTNTGATMVVEESIVDDVNTIKYVPNAESSDIIASDCYNSKLRSVSIPEYKYVTIGYHYKVEEGVTPSAKGMTINFLRNPGTGKTYAATNANTLLINKSDELIFDITGMAAEGVSGNLNQFHFYPFGGKKGSETSIGEVMYIKYITFHANYPYDESPVSVDLSSLTVSGAAFERKTIDGENVLSIAANGGTVAVSASGLESLRLLPSVYKYVMVEYYAENAESVKPVLRIPTLDKEAFEATGAALSNGAWKKAIFNLSNISSVNGQKNYYKDLMFMPFGSLPADNGTVNIKSLTFCSAYPDPDAEFEISFDLNGGEGTVPSNVTAKLGSKVSLPSCNAVKEGYVFAGWSETPDGEIITDYYMPENGATLYAAWAEQKTVFVSADSETISYGGKTNAVDYTTLSEALKALGKDGGTVVMTGTQTFTDLNSVTANALSIKVIGADSTAVLEGFNANINLKAPTAFENIKFVATASGNPYFFAQGYKFTLGKGCTFATTTSGTEVAKRFELIGGSSSKDTVNVTIDSKNTFGVVAALYETAYSGTVYFTINDGSLTELELGNQRWSGKAKTVSGSTVVTVNGGSFSSATPLKYTDRDVKGDETRTGKHTIIFNNDTYKSTYNLSKTDYIINANIGGSVTAVNPGTADTAPTFMLKAIGSYDIYADGKLVGNGECTYTPETDGIHEIRFEIPTFTVTFDANGGVGTVPSPVTAIEGSEVDLSATVTLTKDGCTFIGWNTSPDAKTALESFSVPEGGATLYAVWMNTANTVFVNPDGSGKLTIGTHEFDAVSTITEAAEAIGTNGGTIYFTGTVGNGSGNELFKALEKVKNGKVIIEGVGDNAEFSLQCMTVMFFCDLEFRNLTFTMGVSDWFGYSNGHKIVIGEYGKENDVRLPSSQFIRLFGGRNAVTDITINSGYFIEKFSLANYNASLTGDTLLTVNGGTWVNGVNAGFYSFKSANAFTQTGNSTVIINGGSFTSPKVEWKFTASVTGKKTVIFNNNIFYEAGFTAPDANYVIISEKGGAVSVKTVGNSFLVTPDEGLVPYVNGAALAADSDGNYILTPEADGEYSVSYKAASAKVDVDFAVSLERAASGAYYDIEGYNSEALISVTDSGNSEVYAITEKDAAVVSDANGKAVLTFTAELAPGEYTLTVKKNGYVASTSAFSASEESGSVKAVLIGGDIKGAYGDVCGDGIVDVDDFIRVIRAFDPDSTSLFRAVTDINEDRQITIEDLAIIKTGFKK